MSENQLSDETLMHHVTRGDTEAFRQLFDRYGAQVVGVCYKTIGDRAVAEEITQETFWRIWDNADSFNSRRGSFPAWMFGIARNLTIDRLRKRQRQQQHVLTGVNVHDEKHSRHLVADHNVVEDTLLLLQQQQVLEALSDLPSEQQDVIEWIYFQGKTRREIAAEQEIPFGTINTRARLALDKLRRSLRAKGYDV